MIDNISLISRTKRDDILTLIKEGFFRNSTGNHIVETGEELDKKESFYKGFKFTITPKQVRVNGSIHKYFNIINGRGNQNHNDFSFDDLKKAVDQLLTDIPVLSDFHLTQLEFGINLKLSDLGIDTTTKELVRKFKFYDWTIPFNETNYKDGGIERRFVRSNYLLKVYDKATMYKVKDQIIRIELKLTSFKEINRLGLEGITDLKRFINYLLIYHRYIIRVKKLLILDNLEVDFRKEINKDLLIYSNLDYWKQFKRSQKDTKSRHKKKAVNAFSENCILKTSGIINSALRKKFSELLVNLNPIGTESAYNTERKSSQLKLKFENNERKN